MKMYIEHVRVECPHCHNPTSVPVVLNNGSKLFIATCQDGVTRRGCYVDFVVAPRISVEARAASIGDYK